MAVVGPSGKKEGGVENAAVIAGESARVLKDACDLLFLDSERIMRELTVKVTYAGKQYSRAAYQSFSLGNSKKEEGSGLAGCLSPERAGILHAFIANIRS